MVLRRAVVVDAKYTVRAGVLAAGVRLHQPTAHLPQLEAPRAHQRITRTGKIKAQAAALRLPDGTRDFLQKSMSTMGIEPMLFRTST